MVQVALFALLIFFLVMALRTRPTCPRVKLGYNCRRGSGYECDCEKEPNK